MTATIGFYHQSSNKLQASEYAMQTIREFHPDAYYMLSCDAGPDYYEICKRYRVDLMHSQMQLGYPVGDFGYRKDKVLEMMKRFQIACVKTDTTHLLYVEDDVIIKGPLSIQNDWHVAAYKPLCPIAPEFLNIIERYSGVKPNVAAYGTCGGTIINVNTYLENYPKIKQWVETEFDYVQSHIYPTIGWLDCFLTWFFLMSGKPYTINPYLHQLWPEAHNLHLNDSSVEPQILHGFKKYY